MYRYYPVFAEQDNRLYPFLDSIYASIKLYSGTTESGMAVGGLLQLARSLTLAATLSILVSVFNKLYDVINGIKLWGSSSTVVYGDSGYVEDIFESLSPGWRMRGEEKFISNASRYLIMFSSDARNLEFYTKNYEILKDKSVYIMLEDISRQNIENPLIAVFSMAENCARQYWKDHPVIQVESIAELEHIRWCRYHYLHNWKYGAKTDGSRHTHNCLIPFSELSEEKKIKDIDAIKSKMQNNGQIF